MGATLSRRAFVETLAVGSAACALGGVLMSCSNQEANETSENMAETGEPATEPMDYYTTMCHGCITCCPVKVYVKDGVVMKIEGHPDGPLNAGSLCVKGLNQLHAVYSPRRVLYPMKRTGARGAASAAFERMSWEDAVEEASDNLAEIIKKYGTYALFSSTGGGGAYVGAGTPPLMSGSVLAPTAFEPGAAQCLLPRLAMANFMYGGTCQSLADGMVTECWRGLSKADQEAGIEPATEVIVLWGTQPSCSQTAAAGRAITECRMRGMKTIVVDPNFSADAAKATVHLPLRPGSDCALILSWFRYIFDNDLYDHEFTKYFTNLPMLINPDTKLPWLASEVFDNYETTTPANTPVYVCVDEDTGEVVPLPFGDPNALKVNPQVMATANVKGASSKSAGQIYWEEAEPWTLERAEEFCWVDAETNRMAIEMYAGQLAQGKCAGIAHGVATDQQESSSQATLGLLGLDMIMGYVNKPGAVLTTPNGGMAALIAGGAVDMSGTNEWGKCQPDGVPKRPVTPYLTKFGYGYIVGATEEENAMRASTADQKCQEIWARIVRDRPGLKNHRGLTCWNHSHIPSVRQAIETGEPFQLKGWIDTSGNKLAMLGSAGAWYNAAMKNVDYIVGQWPIMSSFHYELADMFFPVEEWLEIPNAATNPINYSFVNPGIIHLGEAVVPRQPWTEVLAAVYDKLNADANNVVFTGTGETLSELGVTLPFISTSEGMFGVDSTTDEEAWTNEIAANGAIVGLDATASKEEYLEAIKNNPKAFSYTDPTEYWTYGQHLITADDGLPTGFGTESRKCEVYCTTNIKMSRTGWPYNYPQTFDTLDKRIGIYDGEYSPICRVPMQTEAPEVKNSDGLIQPFDPDFPLALTSGRTVFYHHGTMRQAPFARELYPAPFARINPATAEAYGVEDGDWIEISSRRTQGKDYDTSDRGTERSYNGIKEQATKVGDPIRAIAQVTEAVAPNVVWMERFWNPECFDSSQSEKTGGWQECSVNCLTNAIDTHFNEMFGSYTNRAFAVNVKKSERPERIWVQPQEFEPFMPNQKNVSDEDVGVLRENLSMLTDSTVVDTGHRASLATSMEAAAQDAAPKPNEGKE